MVLVLMVLVLMVLVLMVLVLMVSFLVVLVLVLEILVLVLEILVLVLVVVILVKLNFSIRLCDQGGWQSQCGGVRSPEEARLPQGFLQSCPPNKVTIHKITLGPPLPPLFRKIMLQC